MSLRIGEAGLGDQPGAGTHGLGDEGGSDVGELQLGAADEPEGTVGRDVAPDEAQVAVGAVASYERPAEIEAVIIAPDRDLDLPPGGLSIPATGVRA